ncbi:hypothetical protein OG216_12465 [Streptomycetaceae bacterium NBC_01309]
MDDGKAQAPPRSRMTLRTYRRSADGHETERSEPREVIGYRDSLASAPMPGAWPICTCPRCRANG